MLFQRNKACSQQHNVSINSKHQQLDFKSFIVILYCFIGIDYQAQNGLPLNPEEAIWWKQYSLKSDFCSPAEAWVRRSVSMSAGSSPKVG